MTRLQIAQRFYDEMSSVDPKFVPDTVTSVSSAGPLSVALRLGVRTVRLNGNAARMVQMAMRKAE